MRQRNASSNAFLKTRSHKKREHVLRLRWTDISDLYCNLVGVKKNQL